MPAPSCGRLLRAGQGIEQYRCESWRDRQLVVASLAKGKMRIGCSTKSPRRRKMPAAIEQA
jgi:hypothetical protein